MNIEDVIIKKVDKEVLTEFLDVKLPGKDKLYIDGFGVFEDKYMVDIDCCFCPLIQEHMHDRILTVIHIECRIRKYSSGGGYSLRMDGPDFIKTITLSQYLEMANEVRLVDFLRYNYNPRIISNQKLFMKYIKNSN